MRSLFEAIFSPLDAALAAVPFAAGRFVTVAFLVLAAIAVLRLPRAYVLLGAPDRRWYRDLRLWGVAVMIPYVLIYALL